MSITGIARKFFAPRWKELERHNNEAEELQRQVLSRLINRAKDTEYGRYHRFGDMKTYDDFVSSTPINTYEELKEGIDRMRHGEADVLWPGKVKWYAKSSGTTNDKSKFIPVSKEGLKRLHYKGGSDVVAFYLRNNPQSRMFDGRGLILGGSHQPNYNVPGSIAGFCLVLGRLFPVFNNFRGSHASVCLAVTMFCANTSLGIVTGLLVLVLTWLTRYLSLGAIAGALGAILVCVLVVDGTLLRILLILTASIVLVKNLPALRRISRKTEMRMSLEEDISYKFDETFQ